MKEKIKDNTGNIVWSVREMAGLKKNVEMQEKEIRTKAGAKKKEEEAKAR